MYSPAIIVGHFLTRHISEGLTQVKHLISFWKDIQKLYKKDLEMTAGELYDSSYV